MPVSQLPPRIREARAQTVGIQPAPDHVPERGFFTSGSDNGFSRRHHESAFILDRPQKGKTGKRVGHGNPHAGKLTRPLDNQPQLGGHIPADIFDDAGSIFLRQQLLVFKKIRSLRFGKVFCAFFHQYGGQFLQAFLCAFGKGVEVHPSGKVQQAPLRSPVERRTPYGRFQKGRLPARPSP